MLSFPQTTVNAAPMMRYQYGGMRRPRLGERKEGDVGLQLNNRRPKLLNRGSYKQPDNPMM